MLSTSSRLSTLISCKRMLMSNLKAPRSFVMNLSVRPVSLFIWPFHLYPAVLLLYSLSRPAQSVRDGKLLVPGQHSIQLVDTPLWTSSRGLIDSDAWKSKCIGTLADATKKLFAVCTLGNSDCRSRLLKTH